MSPHGSLAAAPLPAGGLVICPRGHPSSGQLVADVHASHVPRYDCTRSDTVSARILPGGRIPRATGPHRHQSAGLRGTARDRAGASRGARPQQRSQPVSSTRTARRSPSRKVRSGSRWSQPKAARRCPEGAEPRAVPPPQAQLAPGFRRVPPSRADGQPRPRSRAWVSRGHHRRPASRCHRLLS